MSLKYVDPQQDPRPQPDPDESFESDERSARAQYVFPYFTILLIGSLAVVYFFQLNTGFDNSFQFAEASNPLIMRGQLWRLITGATMHAGYLHLFFNCMAFYSLGSAIEFLSNRAHLAIVFLFSVVGGSLMSLFLSPDINSVGASGGIIGLAGYLTVYGYKRRRLLPPGFLRNMLINIGFVAAIGIIGYRYIDNAAHLGGFVVGAAYGFIQIPKDLYQDPRKIDKLTSLLGYATLAAFIGFAVLTILLITRTINL